MSRFMIDDKFISPDAAFVHNGVQYPAGWLRMATPYEKASLGIIEVPDPPQVDQRFFFQSGDSDPVPRSLEQITPSLIAQIKAQASSLILQAYPQWKQSNMTARSVELLQKIVQSSLSPEEQSEVAVLKQAWGWIKSVREHSNVLEQEVLGLTFNQIVDWKPYGWPDAPGGKPANQP